MIKKRKILDAQGDCSGHAASLGSSAQTRLHESPIDRRLLLLDNSEYTGHSSLLLALQTIYNG